MTVIFSRLCTSVNVADSLLQAHENVSMALQMSNESPLNNNEHAVRVVTK